VTDSTTAEAQDAGAGAAQDATTPSGQDSPATGFDALPPETQAEIRKLRRESAAYRKRVEEYESANQTEADKREAALKAAEDRAAALETRLRDLSARSAVTDAATKSGAISPRAVFAIIRPDLEFGDDGEPTNVDASSSRHRRTNRPCSGRPTAAATAARVGRPRTSGTSMTCSAKWRGPQPNESRGVTDALQFDHVTY